MDGSLDRLIERHPVPEWRRPALAVAALFLAALGWTFFARFDEVVVAQGEVVPQGQVKTVQHLEGGIIAELIVREGDRVAAGDTLVLLDPTRTGANVDALRAQLDGLEIRRSRLLAEADGTTPRYPRKPSERQPAILAAERQNHVHRDAQLNSALTVVREQIRQRGLEVEETEALLTGLKRSLKVAEERLAMSASLLEDGLTPRMEHLKIQSKVEELRGAAAQTEAALPRVRAALAEVTERERETVLEFRRGAADELVETEVDIARRREMLIARQDRKRRATILAPINGFVQNVRYHTVGGVISPGDPILELVPTHDDLLIEARIDPRDIGHIKVGMRATVKITTYDFVRYGGLDGVVVNVAADASTDASGWHYFRLAVRTDETMLGDDRLPIMAGMQATVDIHTGEKRVLEYLVGPVLRMRHEAFRER